MEDIQSSFRIGRKKDDDNPRALKVILKSPKKKKEIFLNLHKLRNEENGGEGNASLRITHDLTHDQRK